MTRAASGLVILVVAAFAVGFVGILPIGLHEQCKDGIDNDNDYQPQFPQFPPVFYTDAYDENCIEYPYADGNGESSTPTSERFNSASLAYRITGYATAFDWVLTQHTLNPHPYAMSLNQLPLCPVPQTSSTPLTYWVDYPTVEGSEAAYAIHWAQCPP